MKALLSILLLILISFSGISIKLASHYCGGNIVAVKISLSGQQATCGMEQTEGDNSSEVILRQLCCEDISSEYTINNVFIPSTYSFDLPGQKILELPYPTEDLLKGNKLLTGNSFAGLSPPGTKFSSTDVLKVLCTFRI